MCVHNSLLFWLFLTFLWHPSCQTLNAHWPLMYHIKYLVQYFSLPSFSCWLRSLQILLFVLASTELPHCVSPHTFNKPRPDRDSATRFIWPLAPQGAESTDSRSPPLDGVSFTTFHPISTADWTLTETLSSLDTQRMKEMSFIQKPDFKLGSSEMPAGRGRLMVH